MKHLDELHAMIQELNGLFPTLESIKTLQDAMKIEAKTLVIYIPHENNARVVVEDKDMKISINNHLDTRAIKIENRIKDICNYIISLLEKFNLVRNEPKEEGQ